MSTHGKRATGGLVRLTLWNYDLGTDSVSLAGPWWNLAGDTRQDAAKPRALGSAISKEDGAANAPSFDGLDGTHPRDEDRLWVRSEGRVVRRSAIGGAPHLATTSAMLYEGESLTGLRIELENLHAAQVAAQTTAALVHELNQPLTAITSYCATALLLLETQPAPAVYPIVKKVAQQAERAGKILRELLTTLQEGASRSGAVDLNRVIRDAVSIAQAEGLGDFDCQLDLPADDRLVRANLVHVRKVLLSLIRNGVEAMHRGGGRAEHKIISIRRAADGDMAKISIRDNGPGLDETAAARLFEPFFTTKEHGIGMGLITSRALVESNGGKLWLESGISGGCSVHFTLPLAE